MDIFDEIGEIIAEGAEVILDAVAEFLNL